MRWLVSVVIGAAPAGDGGSEKGRNRSFEHGNGIGYPVGSLTDKHRGLTKTFRESVAGQSEHTDAGGGEPSRSDFEGRAGEELFEVSSAFRQKPPLPAHFSMRSEPQGKTCLTLSLRAYL